MWNHSFKVEKKKQKQKNRGSPDLFGGVQEEKKKQNKTYLVLFFI